MNKMSMKKIKTTIGLGVGSMAGMGAMGAMGAIPGMPAGAGAITGTTGAALNLANIGNMANIGMNMFPKSKGKHLHHDKWKHDCNIVNKILRK
jgi:hypothetical protein